MFLFIQCEAKTTLELLYVLTSSITYSAMQVVDVFESFGKIQTVCV